MTVRRETDAFTGVAALALMCRGIRSTTLRNRADKLQGEDRNILKLRPGITGPASLKYRDEEELLASVEDPIRYNDEVIYPDKVRLNLYYYNHYSFWMDIKMIFATVLGKRIEYAGEVI